MSIHMGESGGPLPESQQERAELVDVLKREIDVALDALLSDRGFRSISNPETRFPSVLLSLWKNPREENGCVSVLAGTLTLAGVLPE